MNSILIVEDNTTLRETLALYLCSKLKDYEILTAEDGAQAIEIMATHSLSMVLTDLAMPHIDGYKVLSYAKKNHPTVPVIVMTAAWSLELATLVRKMRTLQYLEKPFQLKDIDELIIEPLLKKENNVSSGAAA